MAHAELPFRPIGVISTPHTTKYDAPRQPATAAEPSVGVITLFERMNYEQALEDLSGFEYVWVIFWFHHNANWKPKVLPPHGGRTKRGVFSTRSPHRPNPIGLSLCRLIDVKGRRLRIENPDMLDGTPVLDIKPYLPHAESRPDARAGWIGESHERSVGSYVVTFAPVVTRSLSELDAAERRDVRAYLKSVLSRDPYPHAYRRIKKNADRTFTIAVRRWRFRYTVAESSVRITGVRRAR